MEEKLLDSQYLDNNFEKYYLIPWPDCQYFEGIEGSEDNVFPINFPGACYYGAFVSAEFMAELAENGL